MMENLTLGYIVSAVGIIGVLIGALMKVLKPIEKVRDYDERIGNLESDTEQIMLSINCLLSHFGRRVEVILKLLNFFSDSYLESEVASKGREVSAQICIQV